MIKASLNQPFKDKTCLFYIRSQCVPRCKHSPLRLYKTKLLILCKAKIVVCPEIRIKHTNSKRSQCRIFECQTLWYVKLPVGFTRLIKTNWGLEYAAALNISWSVGTRMWVLMWFEVSVALLMMVTLFWDVTPCLLAIKYGL